MSSCRALVPALLILSTIALFGCDSGSPQCVIDTDCPLGQRCASDQTCQLIGADVDSGTPRDAGPVRDAMAGEGGVDAGAVDAAAAGEDAAIDAEVDASGAAMMKPPPEA